MGRPAAVAIDAGTKVCSACGLEKPASEFYRHASGYMRGKCIPCFNADGRERRATPEGRAYHAGWMRRWRSENERRWKDVSLRHRFGIGIEDYERMFDEQEGRCASCGDELDVSPHVDHDHKTGAVRGLLCRSCNLMLGFAKDNPARLLAAVAYLERGR